MEELLQLCVKYNQRKLLNLKNKTILAEKTFHLFVKKGEPGGNSSYIDKHGRAIVNGKPFLPIGFYCSRIDESVLKNLKEGGFNCAMPYHGGYRRERRISIPGW